MVFTVSNALVRAIFTFVEMNKARKKDKLTNIIVYFIIDKNKSSFLDV